MSGLRLSKKADDRYLTQLKQTRDIRILGSKQTYIRVGLKQTFVVSMIRNPVNF